MKCSVKAEPHYCLWEPVAENIIHQDLSGIWFWSQVVEELGTVLRWMFWKIISYMLFDQLCLTTDLCGTIKENKC